jgi:hypothetical protein
MESVALKAWVQENVVYAIQDAFFGPKLHEINPDLPADLIKFAENAWKTWYQIPWFLRRHQTALQQRVWTAHQKSLNLPEEDKKASAWFVPTLGEELEKVLDRDIDKAVFMMVFQWG